MLNSKKKRKLGKAGVASATAVNVYTSNLFQMQISELINGITIQYNKLNDINALLHQLKQSIEHLNLATITLSSDDHLLNNSYACSNSFSFQWNVPTQFDVHGDYTQQTQIKSNQQLYVDMYIHIDNSVSTIDGSMYIDARAAYINQLLEQLKNIKPFNMINVMHLYQCMALPILCIDCASIVALNKHSKQFIIRVIPIIHNDTFNQLQFNNADQYLQNNIVALDASQDYVDEQISSVLSENHAAVDAIKLLSVWLIQRDIDTQQSHITTINTNFTVHHMKLYVCHLYSIAVLSKYMAPYQVFKTVLQQLCTADFTGGIMYGDSKTPYIDHTTHTYDTIFLLADGVNYTPFVDLSHMSYIKNQAIHTTSILNDSAVSDYFQTIFATPLQYNVLFDYYMTIQIPNTNIHQQSTNQILDSLYVTKQQLYSILLLAFNSRIHSLYITNTSTHIAIGINVNPAQYNCVVEIGPAADDTVNANKFRDLWGGRSKLRRFKDGQITEAVIFTVDPNCIIFDIAQYIIKLHIHTLDTSTITCTGNQFNDLLKLRPVQYDESLQQMTSHNPSIDTTQHITTLYQSFKKLNDSLRSIDGVPLTIINITPVHPAFRNTAVFVPQPINTSKLRVNNITDSQPDVIDVIVHFEGSNQWPDDIAAISRLKTAFYIQIARSLKSQHGIQSVVSIDYIDIIVDGIIYRLTIYQDKEITLKKQILVDDTFHRVSTQLSIRQHELHYNYQPSHHAAIRSFSATHASYSDTCRIMKRWISAHLLIDYIVDEVIELIVAYTYVAGNQPYSPPNTMWQGFHRVLRLLCTLDYAETPLIIDINNDMTEQQIQTINDNFIKHRSSKQVDGGTLWIGTSCDMSCEWFDMPSKHTMTQLRLLCGSAALYIQQLMSSTTQPTNKQWNALFIHDMSTYDIVIHCRAHMLPKLYVAKSVINDSVHSNTCKQIKSTNNKYKIPLDINHSQPIVVNDINLNSTANILIGIDIISLYVTQLRQTYGNIAQLYVDKLGGNRIAIKLRSNTTHIHSMNIHDAVNTMPIHANDTTTGIKLNMTQLCCDMIELGGDMVQRIIVK